MPAVEVTKLADRKCRVTSGSATMHGVEYCISNSLDDTITFYTDNNSLTARFADITDKHATTNAKDLADYYLVNNFFFR